MDPITAFLLGLAVLLSTAAGTLFLVQRPLVSILVELCGAEHRARFWWRLYGVSLFLLVAFSALWFPPGNARAGFHDFLRTFRAGTFALLAGLALLAFVAMLSIAQHDRQRRIAARKPPPALE